MPNTVRVRIAVAVDPDGNWCAWTSSEWDDGDAVASALDGLPKKEGWGLPETSPYAAVHFVCADIPIPTTEEIPGTVEPATVAEAGHE